MSSWTCNKCGLLNPQSADICKACFSYNIAIDHDPNKYWQCYSCDLLNKMQAAQCVACYAIKKPSCTIGDEWKTAILAKPPSTPHQDLCLFSKMLSWKNKLYTIIITKFPILTKTCIQVFTINHSENNSTNLSNQSTVPMEWSFSYFIKIQPWCINHDLSELYIILFHCYRDPLDSPPLKVKKICLLIYDLDKHKIKNTYTLNFSALNLKYLSCIKQICMVTNTKITKPNSQNIPYYIISNWLRNDKKLSLYDFSIPNEIYILMNKFYSFSLRNSLVHLLILRDSEEHIAYKSGQLSHGKINMQRLHHAFIDLEFNPEKVEIIKSQILDGRDLLFKPLYYLLISNNIKIGNESYIIFDKGTWKVNLQTGEITRTQPLIRMNRATIVSKKKKTDHNGY